jgi:putative transposase
MPSSAAPVWQDYVISDALWARLSALLPTYTPPPHPLGRHRPRLPDRFVLDAIFYVLRTGCQWGALSVTGLCKKTTAHSRFQEWAASGVFARLWEQALLEYDDLVGLDWQWLAADGSLHKAPLGGKKNRRQPVRPRQTGHEALAADGGERAAGGHRH